MAGSLTWRKYTSDNGLEYSIKIDESNANAYIQSLTVLCAIRTANHPPLPCNIKPRLIHAVAYFDQSIKRSFVMGNRDHLSQFYALTPGAMYLNYDNAGTGGADFYWLITGYVGETIRDMTELTRFDYLKDSGLTDGTV